MARVHLQNRIHQIRGGGVAYSWTTKVFYQAKVFAPEVVLLGCCDGAAAAAEAWQLAAADGGGSLRWRQFDNPEGKSSQSARMFDAKRNTKACGGGLFVSCWFLIARDMNKVANKKAKRTKGEPRKLTCVVVQLFGARLGFVCSLVHVLHVFFGPERAGTLFSLAWWYKTVRKALWWSLCQLLLRPVLSCDENGRTRRPKKERRKEHVSVEISLYVKLPVWEMLQISEFVSKNSVDKEFVWDLWVLYLFKFLCRLGTCSFRGSAQPGMYSCCFPIAAGLVDFATCM